MEGTNSSGRKVSLLNNDETSAYFPYPRLNIHSRKSSYSTQMSREDSDSSQISSHSSPAFSLQSAPQLVRFDSTSSQSTLQTPSPMTPNYPFEPLEQPKTVTPQDPYYRGINAPPYYASMPSQQDAAQQPYYNLPLRQTNDQLMEDTYPMLNESQIQQQYAYMPADLVSPVSAQSSLQTPITALPTPATQGTPGSNASSNAKTPAKKKYPCPHAQRFACTDTFTTSGHAARHGKKHTGEKNILCPTCNKAFTRKDNMKQHERTHKNGQDSPSSTRTPALSASTTLSSTDSADYSSRRRIKAAARSRSTTVAPPSLSTTSTLDTDEMDLEEENEVPMSPTARTARPQMRRTGIPETIQYSNLSIDTALAENSRPTFDRKVSVGSQDGEGESPGLDALAIAASGMGSS
ncbi:MAG: Zinc finger and SCAN domain-containing protein 5B [Icmadophila ericetorum]|nr:Zinc finger and SCAN domain-containing protein 5B [Icmadophila ericetorum]